jgi:CyaY protein
MDQPTYLRHADTVLERVARWIDALGVDELDCSTRDGMVTLEFEDGARYVLNRQGGARQMWFAAGDRAWHYDWDEGTAAWRDDRDGHDLYGRIAEVVSAKLGKTVGF